MAKKAKTNEGQFEKREAEGAIRASRFVRKLANSSKVIDAGVIQKIHKTLFSQSWPEIAGKWRKEEEIKKLSVHIPPHPRKIPQLVYQFGIELEKRLKFLKPVRSLTFINVEGEERIIGEIDEVVSLAAWAHHKLAWIHPFREGNGRTARFLANLILEKYGLLTISVKIEKENKERYLKALTQADQHGDYEPLKGLIYEGLIERHEDLIREEKLASRRKKKIRRKHSKKKS